MWKKLKKTFKNTNKNSSLDELNVYFNSAAVVIDDNQTYLLETHTPMEWFPTYVYFGYVKFQASQGQHLEAIQWMCLKSLCIKLYFIELTSN